MFGRRGGSDGSVGSGCEQDVVAGSRLAASELLRKSLRVCRRLLICSPRVGSIGWTVVDPDRRAPRHLAVDLLDAGVDVNAKGKV